MLSQNTITPLKAPHNAERLYTDHAGHLIGDEGELTLRYRSVRVCMCVYVYVWDNGNSENNVN